LRNGVYAVTNQHEMILVNDRLICKFTGNSASLTAEQNKLTIASLLYNMKLIQNSRLGRGGALVYVAWSDPAPY